MHKASSITRISRNNPIGIKCEVGHGLLSPMPLVEADGMEAKRKGMRAGQVYALEGENCDGFEMPMRQYICKGVVNSVNGCEMNGVVMKQINGPQSTIFSLTRTDCKVLGIEWETELQLFPADFGWQLVEDVAAEPQMEFNPLDMGTYSTVNGKIVRMHVFLHDVIRVGNGRLRTPNHSIANEQEFLTSLTAYFNEMELRRQYPIVVRPLSINAHNQLYDEERGGIHLMLIIATNSNGGIDPSRFNGLNIDDVLTMEWKEARHVSTEASAYRLNSEDFSAAFDSFSRAIAQETRNLEKWAWMRNNSYKLF